MKKDDKLVLPTAYYEISEDESYQIEGGKSFTDMAVDILFLWSCQKIGTAASIATFGTLNAACQYATFVNTMRTKNPALYAEYVATYNRHQYCCHTMHAFDGLCPGPNY